MRHNSAITEPTWQDILDRDARIVFLEDKLKRESLRPVNIQVIYLSSILNAIKETHKEYVMGKCKREGCKSTRIVSINAKCSDLCNVTSAKGEYEGYVPDDLGIGGGDYVEFEFCLNCGQIQGDFPLGKADVEHG